MIPAGDRRFDSCDGWQLGSPFADGLYDPLHNPSVDVCQAIIPTRVVKRQPLMVQPQQVKNGGVQVMHMNFVVHRTEAKLIRFAVSHSAPHTTSRHPHREAVMIVVSSISVF